MRPALLLAAALAAPLAATAEPLRGIPADVDAAVHVSYDTAAKSQLHPAIVDLQKRMEKIAAQADPDRVAKNKELLARLGTKPDGAHSFDIGMRVIRAESDATEPTFEVHAVMRMALKKAALDAFAKSEGVAPVVMGKVSGWEMRKLGGTLLRAMGGDEPAGPLSESLNAYAVLMPEDDVVIVAPVRSLAKANDCWEGRSPSYDLPAASQAIARQTPQCHTLVQVEARKIQEAMEPESVKTDKVGLRNVALGLGEDEKDLVLNGRASFVDEAKAKLAAQQITAGLAFATLATGESEEDDADTKFYKGEAAILVSATAVKQDGDAITLHSAFPVARAKVLLAKFGEKLEQTVRENLPQKTAPKPADEDEMDAPAKAPAPGKSK